MKRGAETYNTVQPTQSVLSLTTGWREHQ